MNSKYDWHEQALCRFEDPDLWWYGSRQDDWEVIRASCAIKICNECPVKAECLKQGLEPENLHGGSIWGGLLGSERMELAGMRGSDGSVSRERHFKRKVHKLVKTGER